MKHKIAYSDSDDVLPTDFNSYIKTIKNQEIKVLLLKLKNEARKEEASWEQIKEILNTIKNKDESLLKEIIPFLVD